MRPVSSAAFTRWDELLAAVRSRHPDLYRSWFEQLEPGVVEGGELRVRVRDPAQAHFLREQCSEAFATAATTLTGLLLAVRFINTGDDGLRGSLAPRALSRQPLNPDYTFDQFVVGPSNRLAHAACRAVSRQPGVLYNPLFIFGNSGLGKTHLLQATCHQILAEQDSKEIVFASCESFVNDFVRAIGTGELPAFRDVARSAGALVIDDVQFLAGREESQEELFHTFNTLYHSQKQIILSADSSPSEIPTLEDRLMSRFNWGLVTQIELPNRETRQAILQKKARMRGVEIPEEIIDFIAEQVESNIRTLEGALTKLLSETQLAGRPMSIETAREIVSAFDGAPSRPLQVADILEAVSRHFGLRLADLIGRKRSRSVSFPRQVGMYLPRKLTPLSLEEIGGHFGDRDHSTVLHAERVIETDRRQSRETSDVISYLTRQLTNRR